MNRIILLIIITLAAIGCRKEEEDVEPCKNYIFECTKLYPVPVFKGFKTDEVDTIIVHLYPYNSEFTERISSKQYTFDGTYLNSSSIPKYSIDITDMYDYMIEVPGANKTYKISSFKIPETTDSVICDHYYTVRPSTQCFTWASHQIINNDTLPIRSHGYNYFHILLIK